MTKQSNASVDLPSLLPIGVITKAHGIVGEVKILLYDHDSSSILQTSHLYIKPKLSPQPQDQFGIYTITKVRPTQGGIYLVKFKEVSNRTDAEFLEKTEVFASTQELPSLAEDEIYIKDLIQYQVFHGSEYIGVVNQVLFLAGQDLLVVLGGKSQEIVIPFLPHIIIQVDQKKKTINIDPPEGLLELNDK